MQTCKVDGCNRPKYCCGYCGAHYSRLRRHGNLEFVSRASDGMCKNNRKEWNSWTMMKQRCYNEKYTQYKDYGGRGIKVCGRWLGPEGFMNFLNDMGKRPEGCSLDRIDNNKSYSPDNCRWATREEQSNNTRNNVIIEYCGEMHTLSEWSRIKSFPPFLLYNRIMKNKWTPKRALETPWKRKTRRKK